MREGDETFLVNALSDSMVVAIERFDASWFQILLFRSTEM